MMKNAKLLKGTLLLLTVSFLCINCTQRNENIDTEKYLDLAAEKVRRLATQLEDTTRYPRSFKAGELTFSKPTGWTSGFFPGMIWYMYDYTGEAFYKKQGQRWSAALEQIKSLDWKTHDFGFMVYNSFGKGYEFTEREHYKAVVLQTADSLARLYNSNTGTLESWPWKKEWDHTTIIDNMMNLEMLFRAAEWGDRKELYDIAVDHATTTLKNQVRDDFTTWHVIDYDSTTGEVRGKYTDQGFEDESTWARGQAWGIYGFTMTYRETGDEQFLEAAQNMADVYLKRLPEDFVPYWDFDAPNIPNEPRDASAACITASALLELAGFCKDQKLRDKYQGMAEKMLKSLVEHYMAKDDFPYLLKHSTGSKPHDSEVDVPLIYADYYFIEALMRYRKP